MLWLIWATTYMFWYKPDIIACPPFPSLPPKKQRWLRKSLWLCPYHLVFEQGVSSWRALKIHCELRGIFCTELLGTARVCWNFSVSLLTIFLCFISGAMNLPRPQLENSGSLAEAFDQMSGNISDDSRQIFLSTNGKQGKHVAFWLLERHGKGQWNVQNAFRKMEVWRW